MLFRCISSHHSVTVFLSYQSFIDIPSPEILRKCCDCYFVWKLKNVDEIDILGRRNFKGYNKKIFQNIFSKFKDKFESLINNRYKD